MGVILFHAGIPYAEYPLAFFMTTLFVFSGFFMSMHHPMRDAVTPRLWTRFMTGRLVRFVPLYWLSLALVIAFGAWSWRWDLPLHILLLQSYVPELYISYSYNGVAWFLSSLLFCYALYPFVERWFSRHRCSTILTALLLTVAVFDLVAVQCEQPIYKYLTRTFPVKHLVEFMFGILIYKFYQSRQQCPTGIIGPGSATAIELALLIIVVIFSVISTTRLSYGLAMCLTPAGLTTLCIAMLYRSRGLLTQLLSIGLLQFVSRLSYEIFIFQHLVIIGVKKGFAHLGFTHPDITVTGLVVVVGSIGLAYMLHRYITQPIRQWAKKLEI